MSPITYAIAVLDWPDDLDDALQYAKDIVAAILAGSTGIAVGPANLAITAAQNAQTAVSTGAPGTTTTRDTAFAAMKLEIQIIMTQVQALCYPLNYDDGKALILANGFKVEKKAERNKQNFEVRTGEVPLTVDLIAKAHRGYQAHEWYDSIDEGVTWRYLPTTLQADTVADGYTRGQLVHYRHRLITKDGPDEWHYDDIVIE
jgi:hypothetical protein